MEELFKKPDRIKLINFIRDGMKNGEIRDIAILVENPDYLSICRQLFSEESRESAQLANELGKLARKIRRPKLASEFYMIAYQIFNSLDDEYELLKLQLNRANLLLNEGKFDKADEIFRTLEKQSTNHGNLYGLTLMNYGSCLYQMGDISSSLEKYSLASKIFKENNDIRRIGHIEMNLGAIYLNQLETNRAKTHFNKARIAYKEVNYVRGEIIAQEQVLRVLLSEKKDEECKKLGTELLEQTKTDNNLFARIALLIIKLLDSNEILTYLNPFSLQVQPTSQSPPEVFQLLYRIIKTQIQHDQYNTHTSILLESLLEISKDLQDQKAERELLLLKMWLKYKVQNIKVARRIAIGLYSTKTPPVAELAMFFILINEPEKSFKLLKSHNIHKIKWDTPDLLRLALLYIISSTSLQKNNELNVLVGKMTQVQDLHFKFALYLLDKSNIQNPSVFRSIHNNIQGIKCIEIKSDTIIHHGSMTTCPAILYYIINNI